MKVADTATGRAFMEKLPLTLDMTELNGTEKYLYGVSLPTVAQYFAMIEAGSSRSRSKCRKTSFSLRVKVK